MLLRLLLLASTLTPLTLVGSTLGSTLLQATGADTLHPVAFCEPTQPDEGNGEDDDNAAPPPSEPPLQLSS
jgi:hypothetical protein